MAGAGGGAGAHGVDPQLLCQLVAEVVAIHASLLPVDSRPTRRRFLQTAGVSAGALAGLEGLALGQGADRPNVVVIIVDTLRADHAFGKRARTPNIDALARQGLSFTRFFPEAMPTVPARRSILSGRRVFPFRGWHPYPGLLGGAGLGADRRRAASPSRARCAAPATGPPTAPTTRRSGSRRPGRPFRRSFDRFVRRGGQIGGTAAGVSDAELRHWLPPAIEDPDTRDRVRRYLANGRYSHDETKSFAARVFQRRCARARRPRGAAARSRSSSTRSSRTSRGRRRAGTSTCTATPTTAARSRPPVLRAVSAATCTATGPGARRAHAGALRGRGDHDRPLARACSWTASTSWGSTATR